MRVKKRIAGGVFLYILCLFITAAAVAPFLFALVTSFKTQKEYYKGAWGIPESLFWGNYVKIFSGPFMRYFVNSVIVAAASVTLTIVCAALFSYAVSKIRFRLRGALYFLVIVGMMIPIHTTLIPVYVMTRQLGLYDNIFGLIGPYASFSIPISVVIMTQFFNDIPREIDEAAYIDGCGHWQRFAAIAMPLTKPAVATVAIYNIMHIWNEFIYAMTLIDTQANKTLPVGIRDFYTSETVNIPAVMTALLIGSLPVLMFYFAAQEHVVNGITQGAVKG